jgi:ABC-type uncharacterized transport system auxiliary subunit
MKRLAVPILLLFGLAGCLGSAPPVPRDHYYRVLVPPPVALGQTARFPGVLSVKVLEADGLLRERPLVYSSSGQPHEMQQHDYYYWIDPPPRLLQGQLVDYLRGSGLARSVVTPDLRIKPDLEVTGRIKRLERLLGGGPPRVIAELELGLVYTADGSLIVIESYSAEVAAEDDGVDASVQALNAALSQIFAHFLADASRQDLAGLAASQD